MSEIPPHPFRWSDLARLGLSSACVRRWLADGRIRRVFRGVYCSAGLADTLTLRAACAALVLPPHAVVCDRSAAWLWGVNVHDPDERFATPELEVVSLRGTARREAAGLYAGVRDLAVSDIVDVGGVRVTEPVRTALDLACLRGRSQALATLDQFMRHCSLTHDDFHRLLPRYVGRRGVTQARELVPLAIATSESPGESWTRLAIHDAGLPTPDSQWEIVEDGFVLWRLDHAYPRQRVAVEYDGEEFHGPDQASADRRRRDRLAQRGWHVIAVRKHQLDARSRETWLTELRTVLMERGSRGKRVYARSSRTWVRG